VLGHVTICELWCLCSRVSPLYGSVGGGGQCPITAALIRSAYVHCMGSMLIFLSEAVGGGGGCHGGGPQAKHNCRS
jgi:hypothetical protein